MLQRDRKMFKLIGKNYIKRLITLLFISVLLIGCSQSVKEKTSQVVVKEENMQLDKEVQPEEKQKEKLSEIGLTTEERKAIYCHELGHCFSTNQQKSKNSERNIDDEVDSDTFAVEKCGISPYVLEKALAKSYEYEIQNIGKKVGLTQEALNRYVEEMKTRKRNVQRLIHIFEEKESSRE